MTPAWFLQFAHLLATVAWIGGMIFMKAILVPSLAVLEPPQRGRLMGSIAKRFTALAWSSVVILALTGFAKAPEGLLGDTTTDVGVLLTVKLALFAGMVVVGLVITFGVAPKLGGLAPGAAPTPAFLKAQKALDALSAVNALFGLAILGIVSAF
jgi:uncharacterized membrane protein